MVVKDDIDQHQNYMTALAMLLFLTFSWQDLGKAAHWDEYLAARLRTSWVGQCRIKRVIANVQDEFIGSQWREIGAQCNALPDHIVLSAPLNQRRETQKLHQRTANPLLSDFRLM